MVTSGCAADVVTAPPAEGDKLGVPECEARANVVHDQCLVACEESFNASVSAAEDDWNTAANEVERAIASQAAVMAEFEACRDRWRFDCSEIVRAADQRLRELNGTEGELIGPGTDLDCEATKVIERLSCGIASAPARLLEDLNVISEGGQFLWTSFEYIARASFAAASYKGCQNVSCNLAYQGEYRSCRNECEGGADYGQACVPAGYPEWIDCGAFGADFNLLDRSCGCFATSWLGGICWQFDQARLENRNYGTPCDANGKQGVITFVVRKDTDLEPVRGETLCVPVNEKLVPQLDHIPLLPKAPETDAEWQYPDGP